MKRTNVSLWAGLLVLTGVLVAAWARTTRAADAPTVSLRYISVQGEGSTAKAWFDGAPATGTRVQEALDKFALLGFRVAHVTPAARPSIVVFDATTGATKEINPGEQFYVMVLEKRTP